MAMAKNRNIDFYSARGKDKADFLDIFVQNYQSSPSDMLYIGDDLFDLSIMEKVGHAYCPNDACRDIRELCGIKNIVPKNAGDNVISELYAILTDRDLIKDCTMSEIEALDKKEKF